MFCEKCGNQIKEKEKFCSKCGTPVPQSANKTASQGGSTKIHIPKMEAGKAVDILSSAASEAANEAGKLLEKGKTEWNRASDGDNKKDIFLIAGVVVVVLAIAIISNFARINNFVHKQFTSPEKYYQFVESRTVKEIASNTGSVYHTYVLNAINFYDKSMDGEFSVELGEEGKELVELARFAGVDLSWLDRVSIGASFSIKNNIVGMEAKTAVNKTDLISGNLTLDMDDEDIYLQIPELTKTYLGVDLTEYFDDEEIFAEIQELLEINKKMVEACPSQAQVEKLVGRYLNVALKCVDDVSIGAKTIKADGIQQKCTELKISIDAETMRDIAVAILEEARDDKELQKILVDLMDIDSFSDMSGEDYYDMFQETVDDILSELEQDEYDDSETVLVIKVFVDGKGRVKGRSIEIPTYRGNDSISMLMPEKGREFGFELAVESYYQDVKLTGSGKRSGDKISGDFQIKYNGMSFADITVKDLNTEDLKKGMPSGTLTVGVSSSIGKLVDTEIMNLIGDIRVNLSFDSTARSGKYSVGILRDEKDVGTLSISYKTGNGSKTRIPASKNVIMVEDLEDLEDWAEDIELNQFIDRLEEIGLPYAWIDMAEEIVGYLEDGDLEELLWMLY